jgi:hypothetical protein
MSARYAVGDMHGHADELVALLAAEGLVDEAGAWSGGDAEVWMIGDLVDRGPDGIAVIDLVMRLQREAAAAGGTVGCILGNHEVQLLAADRFGDEDDVAGRSFMDGWRVNGGNEADLRGLRDEHRAWLAGLPPLALVGDTLLVHADSLFYAEAGADAEEVARAFGDVLASDDREAWDELLTQFARRDELGEAGARRLLNQFGGSRIVHGHTPIANVLGTDPQQVRGPLRRGSTINVDHGLYMGGRGFILRLE